MQVPDQDRFIRVPFGVKSRIGVESHGVGGCPVAQLWSVPANVDHLSEVGFATNLESNCAQ